MTHSKSRVDSAGRFLAESMEAAMVDTRSVGPMWELQRSIEIVDWWRESHARPLSRVAANLRRYAGEQGSPIVAQRLKKLPTMADKLLREPNMKLSHMAIDRGTTTNAASGSLGKYRRDLCSDSCARP
jgi:hypothetical protein